MFLDELDDALDLRVADPRALCADEKAVLRLEEHVALADQVLGAARVKDRARVDARRGLERDAAGDVRLDCARDDARVGALGREDEVDAGGAGLRRQARDVGRDLLRALRHEVGDLVDDDDDVGDGLGHVAADGRVAAEHVRLREARPVVEVVDVPDARAGEELQALLHLRDGPLEREDDLLVLGDDRHDQVRQRGVARELDGLRVHHDELELVRRLRHQEPVDERVEADGLALARRAGDEHVRHRREVGDKLLAGGVLAEEERQFALGVPPGGRLDDLAEGDAGGAAVRHLDADRLLAGNRRLDAERLRVQRAHQVVGDVRDGRVADAGREVERVLRDDGPLHRVGERRVDAEDLQRVDEARRHLLDVAVVGGRLLERIEERKRRQDVRPLVLGLRRLGRRGRGAARGRLRGGRNGRRQGAFGADAVLGLPLRDFGGLLFGAARLLGGELFLANALLFLGALAARGFLRRAGGGEGAVRGVGGGVRGD